MTTPTTLTFEDARARHLRRLDEILDAIRGLATDPGWCNPGCKEAKKSHSDLAEVLDDLVKLNNAQATAERLAKPQKESP